MEPEDADGEDQGGAKRAAVGCCEVRVRERCLADWDHEWYRESRDRDRSLSLGGGKVAGAVLRHQATNGIMDWHVVDASTAGRFASGGVTLRWVTGAGEQRDTKLEREWCRERCRDGDLEQRTIAGFSLDGTFLGGAGGFSLHGRGFGSNRSMRFFTASNMSGVEGCSRTSSRY